MAFKYGNVVLCDAVYFDSQSGKAVLAGVYSGDIVFPALPATGRFALLIDTFPDRTGEFEIDLQFNVGGKHVGGAKVHLIAAAKGAVASMLIPPFDLPVEKAGTLQITSVVPGDKPQIILKKNIIQNPIASQMPS